MSDTPVERRAGFGPLWIVAVLAAVLAGMIGFVAGTRVEASSPLDGSAEAGFARDMVVHHAQAVEMSEIVRSRTQDEAIRILATDIALTQQAQIGRFQGWLDAWGLPAAGGGQLMKWMGHPTSGPMPGMAQPEDVGSLSTLSPRAMDVRFLQLMIPHHQAAVLMADAIAELTDRPEVLALARGIAESQAAEIEYMRELLSQRAGSDAQPPQELPGFGGSG